MMVPGAAANCIQSQARTLAGCLRSEKGFKDVGQNIREDSRAVAKQINDGERTVLVTKAAEGKR